MGQSNLAGPFQNAELIASIRSEISKILTDYFLKSRLYVTLGLTQGQIAEISNRIYSYVWEDLLALANRDPAAQHKAKYVLEAYPTFRAIMHYRVANTIYYYEDLNQDIRLVVARKISEDAKVQTGVEIHPAARISKKFVVDHGYGTVIGETCEIGTHCYILQGVVLGATGIADNVTQKRHPTLGNNVQVGAFARLLGPIEIGDNVIISPHCVIRENIPSNKKVTIVNQLQITSPPASRRIDVYGIIPQETGIISIYASNLAKKVSVALLDNNFEPIKELEISVISVGDNYLRLRLSLPEEIPIEQTIKEKMKKISMKLTSDKDIIIVTECLGLRRALESLL